MHFLTLILKVQSWTKTPPRDSTIRSNHSFKFSTNKFHFLSNLFKNIPFLFVPNKNFAAIFDIFSRLID